MLRCLLNLKSISNDTFTILMLIQRTKLCITDYNIKCFIIFYFCFKDLLTPQKANVLVSCNELM